MALLSILTSQRWLSGITRPGAVLLVVIVVGAAMSIWSRVRLETLLQVDDGASFLLEATDTVGDCGTPSIYVIPEATGQLSRYRVLVDFLGGANRFPMLGGGATEALLILPETRPPGVGLGRGLPDTCDQMTLSIAGPFETHVGAGEFPGVGRLDVNAMPQMTMSHDRSSTLTLTYRRPEQPEVGSALAGITLEGIADRWQHGSKRVSFANLGERDVNVFIYEEAGYQFVNESDDLVRPIGNRRAYADANLSAFGAAGDSTIFIYRRRPTSDIELQHDLINVSTIFGIGVSLLIEGILLLVIAAVTERSRRTPPGARPDAAERGEA